MKILVYENRKIEPMYWDASTPKKEEAALKCLFKVLDEEWECYSGAHGDHAGLYKKAMNGDFQALKRLLHVRRDYEYENFRWGQVVDPTQEES